MPRPTRFDWLFRPHVADADLPLSAEARFAEALADLPAVERSALALSEIGGLDTDEIADRLGTEPAIVRKLLDRARESVRTSLATRGRRGITALLPFQNLWQLGSSGPTVRAAGLIVTAIVAPTVAIGGAAADTPRPVVLRADPPALRVLEPESRRAVVPARIRAIAPAVAALATAGAPPRHRAAADGASRSRRPPVQSPRPRGEEPSASPQPAQPAQRDHPAPQSGSAQPAAAKSAPVARVVPPALQAPPTAVTPPVQLPVALPAVPELPTPELPTPELPTPELTTPELPAPPLP